MSLYEILDVNILFVLSIVKQKGQVTLEMNFWYSKLSYKSKLFWMVGNWVFELCLELSNYTGIDSTNFNIGYVWELYLVW